MVRTKAALDVLDAELTEELYTSEEAPCTVEEETEKYDPEKEFILDDDGVCEDAESLEEMKKYVNDTFKDIPVTQWSMEKMFCRNISLNGSDVDLLQMTRNLVVKTLQVASIQAGKDISLVT